MRVDQLGALCEVLPVEQPLHRHLRAICEQRPPDLDEHNTETTPRAPGCEGLGICSNGECGGGQLGGQFGVYRTVMPPARRSNGSTGSDTSPL